MQPKAILLSPEMKMIVDRHNESFQNNFLAGSSIYAASLVHHPSDGRHPCTFPFQVKSVKDERLHEINWDD